MKLQKQYIFIRSVLSNYGRYLSNLSATFVSQAVTALSILLLVPVLLKNLGSEQFGIYFVLLNVITLGSIFDFGLNTGLLRELIHKPDKSQWVINAMFFFFLIVFLVSFRFFIFSTVPKC
jgi:O-antigen/teichoic acid export membrane protein